MSQLEQFFDTLSGILTDEEATFGVQLGEAPGICYTITQEYKRETKPVQTQPFRTMSDQQIFDVLDPVYVITSTKSSQVCVHFLQGNCKLGDRCPYIHRLQ